ncbi:MAG TPA: hypothetical protein VK789_23940 [Bryobacteraceae bacterium]|nr:hypothetical protein [Bryobacteraceae bacterium]
MKSGRITISISAVAMMGTAGLLAQFGGPPPGPIPTGRTAAPEDVTGYWVSLVTEDWRYRMVTPAKGDYDGIPINQAGRKLADAWDPAKDEATGNQCKAYGAAAITRVPGRLHITWQDDKTLKVEADAGTQTRLFHFDGKLPQTPVKPGDASWQGYSIAVWEHQAGGGFGPPGPGGSLKVVTTRMRPGYLRKNGVPYSGDAVVTEYFDAIKEPDGEQYLIVKTLVDDPQYLAQQFLTSTHFKKEPDGSKWHPAPCAAR